MTFDLVAALLPPQRFKKAADQPSSAPELGLRIVLRELPENPSIRVNRAGSRVPFQPPPVIPAASIEPQEPRRACFSFNREARASLSAPDLTPSV